MKLNYCHLCGHPTKAVTTPDGTHWQCQSCGQTFYNNPKPTADAVLVTPDLRVVVAVRAREPHKGMLDLPGGFVDADESLEEAVQRELHEELGLKPSDYSTPVYVMSCPNVYPWGKELIPVVASSFTARITDASKLTPQDDV